MLGVKIRELQGGSVQTSGRIEPSDPVFEGTTLRLRGPVIVDGELQPTSEGDYLWRGHVHAAVEGECRRCLSDVPTEMDEDLDLLFSANPDLEDDPSVYQLDPDADVVDIASAVREELVLLVSAFPLCRPECRGLCATCGADLNAGACNCASSTNH